MPHIPKEYLLSFVCDPNKYFCNAKRGNNQSNYIPLSRTVFLKEIRYRDFFKLSQEFPKESPIELANQFGEAKFNKGQSNYIRLSSQVFLTEILAIDFLKEIQL